MFLERGMQHHAFSFFLAERAPFLKGNLHLHIPHWYFKRDPMILCPYLPTRRDYDDCLSTGAVFLCLEKVYGNDTIPSNLI